MILNINLLDRLRSEVGTPGAIFRPGIYSIYQLVLDYGRYTVLVCDHYMS